MNEKTAKDTKKPYQTPTLAEYGDVREITQGSFTSSMSDSGSNHMTG
jgi:hypothetical protein